MSSTPPSTLPHAVRHQRWDIEVPTQALALALRPRFADWNRSHWLPRIERVLDALDRPGQRIRLARIEIDLGTVSSEDLETVVGERLEEELRRVLGVRLHRLGGPPEEGGTSEGSLLREETAWLELFEHYLLHGTLPFWSPCRTFHFQTLLRQLAAQTPADLEEVVRRHGHRRRVLERLVAQLDRASFQALLQVLEPGNAALLVAYLLDVGKIHRSEPLLPLSERELEFTLGLLTLSYLVTERGSRFNRKSYVRSLLRGLGRSRGLGYEELLQTLGRCLGRQENRWLLRSSLPEVIGELLEELEEDASEKREEVHKPGRWTAERLQAALRARLRSGEPPTAVGGESSASELVTSLVESHPAAARRFLESLRHHKEDRVALAQHSSPAVFEQVLEVLCPEEADGLAELMGALGRVPSPYRPRAAAVREAVLAEVLRAGVGRPLTEAVFSRVLSRLFRSPLPTPVARSLDHEIAVAPARLPEARRAMLRSAIVVAAGREADQDTSVSKPKFSNAEATAEPKRRRQPAAEPKKEKPPPKERQRSSPTSAEEVAIEREALYLENAGLVLIAPFLPRLLHGLDVFQADAEGKPRLADLAAASRAVHLVQYLVDGRTAAAEPELVLPKVLCGWPIEEPVLRQIEPSEAELALCDSLLRSMLATWTSLGNTSVAGLRQTFLEREGRLESSAEGWRLRVQRKTVDVLVDQVPWGFSVIFHGFMKQPLHVNW